MEMSAALRSELTSFKKQVSVRSQIVTDTTLLEQVNAVTYLGIKISYEEEEDVTSKISNFFASFGNSER
jgi:hypothetical protein